MKKETVNKTCKGCSSEFAISKYDHNRGRGKFCSKECYSKHRTDRDYTYHALHTWLWRNYRHLKRGVCQFCETKNKRTEWANISKTYKKDINDYLELCKKCHDMFDCHKHDNFKGYKHTLSTKKRIAESVRRNRWNQA